MSEIDDKVQIDIDRDGCMAKGTGFTVSISTVDSEGVGHGHRISGPKFCAMGNNQHVTTAALDRRDAEAVFHHIRPLLDPDWLRAQFAPADPSVCEGATPPGTGGAG